MMDGSHILLKTHEIRRGGPGWGGGGAGFNKHFLEISWENKRTHFKFYSYTQLKMLSYVYRGSFFRLIVCVLPFISLLEDISRNINFELFYIK